MSFLPPSIGTATIAGITKIGAGLTAAADGTAAVAYGTATGTAAQGNDSRIVGAVQTAQIGAASGVAGLDTTGKVPLAQLPASVVGALHYLGTWNASTNTPTLTSSTAPSGGAGGYYIVSTAGTTTLDGLSSWGLGDYVLYDSTKWDKLDGQAIEVISVAGRTGAVVLTAADVGGLATVATSGSYNDLLNKPAAATYTSTAYTAAGAIAPTDDESVINTSAAVTMTLAAGTVTHLINIKRYGSGAVTVTANMDGASQSIVLNTTAAIKECLSLRWNVALSTWLVE